MQFVLVTAPGLTHIDRRFAEACSARRCSFARIVAGRARQAGIEPASEGRLLYCAAIDRASALVEKLLFEAGTAALHDPHFICDHQPIRLAQAGLPTPPAIYAPASDPTALAAQIERLGGFPVVVKRAGAELGEGVSMVEDMAALHVALAAPGGEARIESFFPHEVCWRVMAFADRPLAATAHRPAPGDFRSNASGGRWAQDRSQPPGLAALALRALAALRLDFGGVDVMEGPDGRLALAEVNFPCSFTQAEMLAGVDVAGSIVDRLLARAERAA